MSNIIVFRELTSNTVFVAHGSVGTWPINCLRAVGGDTETISVMNEAKRYPDLEEFYEVTNTTYDKFVDEDGNLHGSDASSTVNKLNSIFRDTGGTEGLPPVITSASSINVNAGDPINYFLEASGGVGYEWSGIPTGLAIAEGNLRNLVGSLNAIGTYTLNMTAVNYFGSDTSSLTIEVSSGFSNTKSVILNFQEYLNTTPDTNHPMYRASNGAGSSDAWTLSFWVKPSASTNTNQTLFYFGGDDMDNESHVYAKFKGDTDSLYFRYGSNNNYLLLETATNSLPEGVWKHVMITYDGGTTGVNSGDLASYYGRFEIFIDGVSQSTTNSHSNYGTSQGVNADMFRIARNGTTGNYSRGNTIEEIAIWDSDQTANIASIYNSGNPFDLSTLGTPPQHWWRMGDNDTYPLLQDSGDSSTDYDFTMTNMVASDIVNDVP